MKRVDLIRTIEGFGCDTPLLITYLHARTALCAIGKSTLRSQGAPGMVDAARSHLFNLNLRDFSVGSEAEFQSVLNRATVKLAKAFPGGGQGNWGAARKSLNIFLRDVVYNRMLSEHFKLAHIHSWLELPMDSHCHSGLALATPPKKLDKWPGVKHLKAKENAVFQVIARDVATKRGVLRCDLDVLYWRKERIEIMIGEKRQTIFSAAPKQTR